MASLVDERRKTNSYTCPYKNFRTKLKQNNRETMDICPHCKTEQFTLKTETIFCRCFDKSQCHHCESYYQKMIGTHLHHFCKLLERQDGYYGLSGLVQNCPKERIKSV